MARHEVYRSKAGERHANMVLATDAPPIDTSKLRYDYSAIEAQHRQRVMEAAVDILAHGRRAKESIIAMGERLIEVKALLPDGTFTAWLTTEFELSPRMAENFMNVARQYGERPEIISVLNDTVLYLLAAPSTPESARREVEALAIETGRSPKVETAKRVIAAHRPQRPVPQPAPAKEVYVKPAAPQYAQIYDLERAVSDFFDHDLRGMGDDPLANKLSVLQFMRKNPASHPDFIRLEKRLPQHYRQSDLIQAINNVREQKRQAQRKRDGDLREISGPHATEAAEAAPSTFEEEWDSNIVSSEWVVETLVRSRNIDDALRCAGEKECLRALAQIPLHDKEAERRTRIEARLEQLRMASDFTASLPDHLLQAGYRLEQLTNGLWRWRHKWPKGHYHIGQPKETPALAIEDAVTNYKWQAQLGNIGRSSPYVELQIAKPPDPRIAQAKALQRLLRDARDTTQREYGALTGRHTLLPPFERAVEALLEPLDSLLAILERSEG